MGELVIETTGLTKVFGKLTAVRGVNLQVPQGALYGFLGPNGAGKSTTIRLLLGLLKPTAGTVKLFNQDLREQRLQILRRVGALVEGPSYYENLTAAENLEITRKILELHPKEIDKALDIVNLGKWKHTKVKDFSLGMKQRLGIAQALMGKRELLILDEPTNGLDPAGVREIRNLIISLPEMLNVTVLISSHILSEIELIADHVGIIHKGELLFQGTLAELKAKGRTGVCIKAKPLQEASVFLRNMGYAVENREGRLWLPISRSFDGQSIAEINKTLVMAGFEVSHLSEETKNLEEIFLDVTGGLSA